MMKIHRLSTNTKVTPLKTNIAPENGWLEYYFPIGEAYFQGRAVSLQGGYPSQVFLPRELFIDDEIIT